MARIDLKRIAGIHLPITIGGFAGAFLRYLSVGIVPGILGTLVVNVLGSLLLGFFAARLPRKWGRDGPAYLLLTAGFLSSYTTYSTFALETALAPPVWFIANILATYVFGFGAAVVGGRLARRADVRWS